MKKKDLEYIDAVTQTEGFDYGIVDYSDFEQVKDIEFHKLRDEFLAARERFKKYLILEGLELEE